MLRALWTGRSGLMAQQEKLDCISNNLTNVDTVGYKREEMNFEDLMSETLKRKGYPTSEKPSISTGTGVKATDWIRNRAQGSLKNTGSSSDLALDGQGFFRVTMPNGSKAYQRAGDFIVDRQGNLVNKNGLLLDVEYTNEGMNFLQNVGGLSSSNFSVAKDGTVSVRDQKNEFHDVGKINVYNSVGDQAFISIGSNLYKETPEARVYTVEDTDILQGYLENSNVDYGKEMTDMILSQRAFELSSRSIKSADEMWGMVNNMKR